MNLIKYFFHFDKKTIMNPEQGSGIKKLKINCIFLISY
jgi:hypothetical protein